MRFIWVCDEYEYSHPRVRLHVAFSLIILVFMGSRPGEFVESGGWKNSNEGLQYGDVELIRRSTESYHGYVLEVRMRNRKGHRKNKKHAYVIIRPGGTMTDHR
jgi:hypothetical protein